VEKFTSIFCFGDHGGRSNYHIWKGQYSPIGTFETVIANRVLSYMLPLTKQLQSTNLDIIIAYEEARNVRQVIANQRNEQGFMFSKSHSIGQLD